MKMDLKIPAILVALLLLGALDAAAKVDLDRISVTLSESSNDTGDDSLSIDVGEPFYVNVNLEGPDDTEADAKFTLKIEIDGVVVYEEKQTVDFEEDEDQTVSIGSDELDEDGIWVGNLMDYNCEEVDVQVTVSGSDLASSKTDKAKLEYEGNELNVKLKPSSPTASDEILITVTDEDDDEVKDVTVKFTNLGDDEAWDEDDEDWRDKTDGDGEVEVTLEDEFDENVNGKYQLDVWVPGGEYCKETSTIDARRALGLGSPDPADPTAGQSFKLRVTDDAGAGVSGAKVTVTVSRTNEIKTYNTDMSGYVVIQINASGSISIVASKTGYSNSPIKSLTLGERNTMNVVITPTDATTGSDVEIKVTVSDGSALKGARVVITKPDTSTQDLTTSDAGKVSFKPSATGLYKVKVEALTYATKNLEFTAYNAFTVAYTDNLAPKAEITVSVADADNKPVQGATVSIREAGVSGSSDYNGKYIFRVDNPGMYTVSVKKEGYRDYEKKLEISGALTVKVSAKQADIGDTIEFAVLDSQEKAVEDAVLKVTGPDGTEETVATKTFKVSSAGTYTVTATKTGYSSGTATFEVNPYQLTLKPRLEGGKIVVTATSDGKPKEGITIAFNAPGLYEEVDTDSDGQAVLDAAKLNITGNVTITAKDQNYEEAKVVQEVKAAGMADSSTLLVILVALVVLVIAIIAVTTKGGRRREKGVLYRTGGTHLDR